MTYDCACANSQQRASQQRVQLCARVDAKAIGVRLNAILRDRAAPHRRRPAERESRFRWRSRAAVGLRRSLATSESRAAGGMMVLTWPCIGPAIITLHSRHRRLMQLHLRPLATGVTEATLALLLVTRK